MTECIMYKCGNLSYLITKGYAKFKIGFYTFFFIYKSLLKVPIKCWYSYSQMYILFYIFGFVTFITMGYFNYATTGIN